jgi:hypothetical protein
LPIRSGSTYSCFTPDYIPDRPRRAELVHSYPRSIDPSISYYLWPRAAETWMRTVGLVDASAADGPCGNGLVPLNARIETDADHGPTLVLHAPACDRLLLFADAGRMRMASAQPVTIFHTHDIEILRGHRGPATDAGAVTVAPDDGVIELTT